MWVLEADPIRIVRLIARLNIGGPAIQAVMLTSLLEEWGYRTRLVRGREDPAEGNMDYLARDVGVRPTLIRSMRRDPGAGDLQALGALIRILRSEQPHIVHTHAAKAGTLGRLATLMAFPGRSSRPRLVHTFHGHSLTGYFGGGTASFYRGVERFLARRTEALIAVSAEVADDLARLGVAPRARFTVVPLGFDLSSFVDDGGRDSRRACLRSELRIPSDAELVTLIARLVPIKRVDRFLRLARMVAQERPRAHFLIVGDGELRHTLQRSADALALEDKLAWAGFRRDMPDVCFASDVVALTSDNEGTPVSLIEAQAAAVPVVGTDVGGVRAAVRHGQTGLLAPANAEGELAEAIAEVLKDTELARRLGQTGRTYVTEEFRIDRLAKNLDSIYRGLCEDDL